MFNCNVQCSIFNVQCLMFNLQCSTLNFQSPMLNSRWLIEQINSKKFVLKKCGRKMQCWAEKNKIDFEGVDLKLMCNYFLPSMLVCSCPSFCQLIKEIVRNSPGWLAVVSKVFRIIIITITVCLSLVYFDTGLGGWLGGRVGLGGRLGGWLVRWLVGW